MRIISGDFKGRALAAPKGQGTRPTTDRTREALFNVLAHANWAAEIEGAHVIDLFAGSGALGFEALSRGAAFCLFVETDAAARGAIRENIEALSVFGRTRLHRRSATDLGRRPSSSATAFSVAFLDPPYGKDLAAAALRGLEKGHWLADKALAVVETSKDEELSVDGWDCLDTRTYGAAKVWFLKRG